MSRNTASITLFTMVLAWAPVLLRAADKPQISVLTIEVDNVVVYVGDVTDPGKLALVAGATTPAATRAFTETITIGDVVKVNGRPAKGLWSSRGYTMGYSPTAAPGFAVSDAAQGGPTECRWEIQAENGSLVGRFMEGGLAPHQISGGSGVFFGIHGQQSVVQTVRATRRASMTEDPVLRRALGGGNLIHTFHVAPSYLPAIEGASGSPEVLHAADFSPVTVANPARAGEVLVARATNLGLTTPEVVPGAAFSNSPNAAVNAPVEAVLGGQAVDAINALGWPGEVNVYRVDFEIPRGTAPGTVNLQLRASGIAGPAVAIPVR